jgi:hypothetical protein
MKCASDNNIQIPFKMVPATARQRNQLQSILNMDNYSS